jgi:hypothetical protein
MKSKVQHNPLPPPHMTTIQRFSSFSALLLTLALSGFGSAGATDTGNTFATAEDAVSALVQAVSAESGQDLRTIFGPAAADIQNADRVQATNDLHAFTAALNATNRLVHQSDTKCVLEVGDSFWPFPIPIVKKDGRWFFDTEAGKDEILSRRIGKNELNTLQVMRAYVAAQREYASRDRNGDEVLEFAQRIASTPGNKDGLYWPPDLDGEISPLGPMVADAQAEGYTVQSKGQDTTRLPFHGYFFKILTQQGKHAPGGKYNYIINGHMIGGFAMVAWPAEYGDSGIMTFIVSQQGRVYQKDLGPKTGKLAADMKVYDPDPSWAVSPD